MSDFLVAVVGSRGLIEGRIPAYVDILQENGFTILEQETLEVTESQAHLLLGPGAASESSLDSFLSGPCVSFLLKRDSAYSTFDSLRLELDYTYGSLTGWLALRDMAAFFPAAQDLERLLVVVKPGYESHPKGNVYAEVMRLAQENDFVVLAKEMRVLGAEAAKQVALPTANGEEPSASELEYLQSDMSLALILEKVGAIQQWQLLIGPSDPTEARQHAPHTLRARFAPEEAAASAPFHNLLYASDSYARGQEDLSLFFPAPLPLQRTVAIFKPDVASSPHLTHQLLDILSTNGFVLQAKEEVYMSKARAELFYQHVQSQDPALFEELTTYMSSGPCLVLLLSKPGAIESLLKLLGPSDPVVARSEKPLSLRAKLGGQDVVHNALHGSESEAEAKREMEEFFPLIPREHIPSLTELQEILSAKPSPPSRAQANAHAKSLYEVLLEGLTELCRVKPTGDDAVLYLSDWLLAHNPNKPAVEEPQEVKPKLTLSEELDASTQADAASVVDPPGPLQVTWMIGAPGLQTKVLAARITKELAESSSSATPPVEWIDVAALLTQAAKTNSEHGAMIDEYMRSGRALPPHVVTPLLLPALANASSRHVLLASFPFSLDQSFDFEAKVGSKALKQLIYLEVSPSDAAGLAVRKGLMDCGAYQRQVTRFCEEMQPVLEHYQLFKKVRSVQAGVEEEEEVCRQIIKFLTK